MGWNEFLSMLGLTVAATVLGTQISAESEENKRWWDFYHKYYEFGVEYTDQIDRVLMMEGRGVIGPKRLIAPGRYKPGIGQHIFKAVDDSDSFGVSVVNLEKKINRQTREEFYIGWISPFEWGATSITQFERMILQSNPNSVQVYSIDISGTEPRLLMMNKICQAPRDHQTTILNKIKLDYISGDRFNVKTIISGPRGSGKTYIGKLLKKKLEQEIPGTSVRLYDDFDPTAVGVNINRLALSYASEFTPVIIVINEIDQIYSQVLMEDQDFDPRLKHSRNKGTFNNMLDSIADTSHVIVIFTMESSFDDIIKNEEYRSFVRPGRIDLRATMTDSTSSIEVNV